MVKKKILKTTKKKVTKKVTKSKTKNKKKFEIKNDLHKVFRRKRILCHTCKNRMKCEDALTKRYPYVCMIYIVDEKAGSK